MTPKGHQKISQSDAFGRLVKVEEYSGVSPAVSLYATTIYDYDERDNLIGVTDHSGNQTTIVYDALGRKTDMQDPDMGQWFYTYDPAGSLTRQTDARGQRTCLYYDALNRLTGKYYHTNDTCPANPSFNIGYTYDTGTNGQGRRTGMTDAAGTVSWSYDSQGRLLSETRHFSGTYDILDNSADPTTDYVTRYSYDMADRVIKTTYPDGEEVTTNYTLRSLPTILSGSNLPGGATANYITGASYNALGSLTNRTGGGLTTIYTYYTATEDNNRLKNIQVGSNLLKLTYSYDNAGNIIGLTDNSSAAGNETLSFGYDHLDRLISANRTTGQTLPPYNETYGYNAIGNLISRNQIGYIYPASGPNSSHPHAVTNVSTNTYQYDQNGNMTSRTENGITYT